MRYELGIYVLGAVAPADRSAVEKHLSSCAGCRDQLADLAGLPGLLRRIAVEAIDDVASAGSRDGSIELPDRSLGSLLAKVARRRSRRTRSELAGAAAAAVTLAAGAAVAFGAGATPPQRPVSMALPGAIAVHARNPRDGAGAVVMYAGQPWGVKLYVRLYGVAAGTKCLFEVTDSLGHESEAGSWTVAAGDEDAWYAVSSSVPLASVRGFVVMAGAHVLVRVGAD